MPLQRIYSVYDEKAEEFSPPFYATNDRMAQRIVVESSKGNGSMLGAYPEDFKLYALGSFDTTTGDISVEQKPRLLISVKLLLNIGGRNVEN